MLTKIQLCLQMILFMCRVFVQSFAFDSVDQLSNHSSTRLANRHLVLDQSKLYLINFLKTNSSPNRSIMAHDVRDTAEQISFDTIKSKSIDTIARRRLMSNVKRRFNRPKSFPVHSSETSNELSHNISKILENLLQGYDQNQRPVESGGRTIITTNLHIRSMGPMSEKDMEYSLDCYFRQKWRDVRLKYEGSFQSLSLNIHMLERIWKPDTYFHNGKGSYLHTITRPNKFLRINKNGEVYYSMRLTIKARCIMKLENFPMDKQSCPLIFGSYSYKSNELLYIWDPEASVSLTEDLVMSQFDLISYPTRNGTIKFRRGKYSMVQVNFNFIRHTGYFLIQIYFPCALIVILSWVSFWINREATSDRVGLGMTSVLTLSTFGLDTRTDFPKVSYPTALDWFVIMCFSFVIATLLEFAAVHYFTKVGYGEHSFAMSVNAQPPKQTLASQKLHRQLQVVCGQLRALDQRTRMAPKSHSASNLQFESNCDLCSVPPTIHQITDETSSSLDTFNQDDRNDDDDDDDDDVLDKYGYLNNYCNDKDRNNNDDDDGDDVVDDNDDDGNADDVDSEVDMEQDDDHWFTRLTVPKAVIQCISCVLGSESYKRWMQKRATGGSRHVNSVSRIDKLSRIAFPFSFVLLNLIYWRFYFTERNAGFLSWEDGRPID